VLQQAASIHDLKLPMLLPGISVHTSADDFAPIKQIDRFEAASAWRSRGQGSRHRGQSRAQIMSGPCPSFHPTRIDTHSVGGISEPCRPLYRAESEMTHDADRNYRNACGKKCVHASSSALL
jgi:hypothetical protein